MRRPLRELALLLGVAVSTATLHSAAQRGDKAALLEQIEQLTEAADINLKDNRGLSALHVACYKGHADAALVLLDHGASVLLRDSKGMTPLHLAALGGSAALARALLEHAAVVDAVEPSHGATALHLAVTNPEAAELAGVLLEYGASLDIVDGSGHTPAAVAMSMDNAACIELFAIHERKLPPEPSWQTTSNPASSSPPSPPSQPSPPPPPPSGESDGTESCSQDNVVAADECASTGASAAITPAAVDSVPALFMLPGIEPARRGGDAMRREDWNAKASEYYSEGDFGLAVQHLYLATKQYPFGGHTWANLGQALLVHAMRHGAPTAGSRRGRGQPARKEGRRQASHAEQLLCEAVAAFDLAHALAGGDGPEDESRRGAIEMLHHAAGCSAGVSADRCHAERCAAAVGSQHSRARRALALPNHDDAVAELCGTGEPARVTVALPEWERRRGVLSARTALLVWATFRVCGVVAVEAVLDTAAVERVREASDAR